MAKHAKLSPSSAERWMTCPGSIVLSAGLSDDANEYSMEGTCAHFLAAFCLEKGTDPSTYFHATLVIQRNKKTGEQREGFLDQHPHDPEWETIFKLENLGREFCNAVADYVEFVRGMRDINFAKMYIEQSLPLASITGEEDAAGTSDVILVAPTELIVIDLKFGQGVKVDAQGNPQLRIYALAAYELLSLILPDTVKKVRTFIHQPRLQHISEEVLTIEELLDFGEKVQEAAVRVAKAEEVYLAKPKEGALPDWFLAVSDKGCKFCKAKADCPELADFVAAQVNDDFDDLTKEGSEKLVEEVDAYDAALLSTKAKAIDLIETWCKAVRAKVESLLLAGTEVPDFKLVQGKKGNRKWDNEAEVEAAMKSMRLKVEDMYKMNLITPAQAETLLKKEKPKCWNKLTEHITQSEGALSVAPLSDSRPAVTITPVADEMDDYTQEPSLEDLV